MKALNGKVGDYVSEQLLKKQGIRCLGFFDYGFRNVYSKKEIRTPDDFKGLKIRTMTNKAHMALFKAFGANPTPMGWSELYTGLQQGVIDAAENNADVWFDQGHYEVAPVMSQTQHLFLVVGYFMSEKFFQSLPSDLQKEVLKAAQEAMLYNSEIGLKGIVDARPILEKKGARFVDIKDLTPFAKIARTTWMPIAKGVPNGEKLLKIVMDETGVKLDQ
jgi:TRAP-type C4-dicarboxylate transport system substrate-binding protein